MGRFPNPENTAKFINPIFVDIHMHMPHCFHIWKTQAEMNKINNMQQQQGEPLKNVARASHVYVAYIWRGP